MSKTFVIHPDARARADQLTQMLNVAYGAQMPAEATSCHSAANLSSDEHATAARQRSPSGQSSGDT